MIIRRVWAMPNKWTFQIPPIADLVSHYVGEGRGWIDPFAGMNSPAEISNDLNPAMPTTYHLDALEFCHHLDGCKYKGILFDPPYSLRQVAECYKQNGLTFDIEKQLDASFSKVKDVASKKIIAGGYALSFGWNTNGLGKCRGFQIMEILLVAHGGHHNDTICTVEIKNQQDMQL